MSSSKQKLLIMGVSFIMVSGVAFGIAYKLSGNTKQPSQAASTSEISGTKENPHIVVLKKDNKEPVDILLKTGDYIQFNSADGAKHQIIQGVATAEHGPTGHVPSPLDSGEIKPDEGYLLQFKKIGKYEFHDNYNHDATITVIVYDPSKSSEDIKLTR